MNKLNSHFKVILLGSLLLTLVSITAAQVYGQKSENLQEPMDLWSVRKKLVFRTRKGQTLAELNRELIAEVRRRKVSFLLSEEDRIALQKSGASELLIASIKENEPRELRETSKTIDEANTLYIRFVANYAKRTLAEMEVALAVGKEFLERYGNIPDLRDQVDFVRPHVARLERVLKPGRRRDFFRPYR